MRIFSEGHKEKLRQAHLGKRLSEEHRKKIGLGNTGRIGAMNGKHHSQETIEKIRAANKGQVPWMKGKHQSEEAKLKIRQAMKDRQFSNETRRKISEALKGKPGPNKGKRMSNESKMKLSVARRGMVFSEETKKKISEHRKGKSTGHNNPNWAGGVSFEPYSRDFNKYLKDRVRNKYGGMSLFGTMPEAKEKLSVHHINYDKKDCREINLIPLTRKEHAKTNRNRSFWLNFFCQALNIEPSLLMNGGIDDG